MAFSTSVKSTQEGVTSCNIAIIISNTYFSVCPLPFIPRPPSALSIVRYHPTKASIWPACEVKLCDRFSPDTLAPTIPAEGKEQK